MEEYRVEDWFPHQCQVCNQPCYIGAGIKKPQCSNCNCFYYCPPPIPQVKQQDEQQAEESDLVDNTSDRSRDSMMHDDLYFHDGD